MSLRWKCAMHTLAAALIFAAQATADEPAPVAPTEAPAAAAEIMEEGATCEACEAAEEEEEGRWTLINLFDRCDGSNAFADHGFFLTGSLVQSYTYNPDGPTDRFNGPLTWTDRSNEYQMNQLWLSMGKAIDTSECDWDIGGNATVIYGTNARFITAFGFDDFGVANNDFYGLVVPNLYGEIGYKNLSVKAGKFASPVGYFGIDMASNIFNTLPYTFQYGEPFTHTGVMATWAVNDSLSVGSGIIRGWDNWNSQNPVASPGVGYLGTFTYTMESGASIGMVFVYSEEANDNVLAGNGSDRWSPRYLQTFVFTQPIGEKLTYVFQSDYGHQENALANGKTAQWYGVNQYLLYQQNDCLTWAANFEWFQDADGFRVGGFQPVDADSGYRGLATTRTDYEGAFFQTTMGPRWQPYSNLFIRPNLRFDWFTGTSPAGNQPFDDGTSDFQTTIATDITILF